MQNEYFAAPMPHDDSHSDRRLREAEALRANLKRRKAQARRRHQADGSARPADPATATQTGIATERAPGPDDLKKE
jgi:hypothetical protein